MKVGRLLRKVVRFAKNNPEVLLGVAGAIAPKVAGKVIAKAGPIITATKATKD